ncbi:hypothetical protein [Spiroplasma endosymbiont of Polydrusus pterygomalis]|uniref:hypothetical protein n=1 Tax=Spiroplasma endosymbiont of Polydrusus pterygomalis TaxID=3139327 RepID=UPI003CCB66C7
MVLPHFQHKNEEIIPNGQEIITTAQGTYQNLETKFHNFEINTDILIKQSLTQRKILNDIFLKQR